MPEIWLEKYRPIKFEAPARAPPLFAKRDTCKDVVGNSAAVTILRSHATAGQVVRPFTGSVLGSRLRGTFPHLLLTGPPGCGKTTVVHCLARPGWDMGLK